MSKEIVEANGHIEIGSYLESLQPKIEQARLAIIVDGLVEQPVEVSRQLLMSLVEQENDSDKVNALVSKVAENAPLALFGENSPVFVSLCLVKGMSPQKMGNVIAEGLGKFPEEVRKRWPQTDRSESDNKLAVDAYLEVDQFLDQVPQLFGSLGSDRQMFEKWAGNVPEATLTRKMSVFTSVLGEQWAKGPIKERARNSLMFLGYLPYFTAAVSSKTDWMRKLIEAAVEDYPRGVIKGVSKVSQALEDDPVFRDETIFHALIRDKDKTVARSDRSVLVLENIGDRKLHSQAQEIIAGIIEDGPLSSLSSGQLENLVEALGGDAKPYLAAFRRGFSRQTDKTWSFIATLESFEDYIRGSSGVVDVIYFPSREAIEKIKEQALPFLDPEGDTLEVLDRIKSYLTVLENIEKLEARKGEVIKQAEVQVDRQIRTAKEELEKLRDIGDEDSQEKEN